MLIKVLAVVAILAYLASALMLFRALANRDEGSSRTKRHFFPLSLLAVLSHGVVLQQSLFSTQGVNVGFTVMLSLAGGFIATLLVLSSWRKPTENLGVVVFPIAALLLLIQLSMPTAHILSVSESKHIGIHILFSILAYSLLGLAAFQALLLSYQERQLHNRQPGGIIRALPPMETMETLLFQMIIIGFTLQTMSLISGALNLQDMFAQHMVHKTVLSVLAWSVFAILLIGHWRFGWRGRTAVRWTLAGFLTLLLAYFGSKYVLEIILAK